MTVRDATRRALGVLVAALGATLAFGTATALANTFTVTTTADGNHGFCSVDICTLRDAVIAANAAPGSTINVPAGTYNLTIPPSGPGNGDDDARSGDLNITAQVTIAGAGAATTIIDGGGSATTITDRVFRVESGGSLTLSGATIQHGHPAGGAGLLSEGGGILALGPLSLTDATVSNNFVETPSDQFQGAGAGISQEASVAISLTRVTVSNNAVTVTSGVIGGGGGLMLEGAPGSVIITDSTISGNTAAGPGGGIYSNPAANSGSITITGTTIAGNHAVLPPGLDNGNHAWGGGLATDGSIPVTLANDSVVSNTADQSGGGIFDNGSSTYTITDSTIGGNTAVAGCTSCGVDFVGGGGIVADGGSTKPGWTLSGDTIAGNTAGDANHPNVPGGGIDEDGGDKFTVLNTTIVGNTATGIGGGYESSGGGTHTLTNVTIDLNRAGSGGGSIDNSGGGTFTLANTIVSRGTPANCNAAVASSLGHNIDTAGTCGFNHAGDLTNTDPKLSPPSFSGGPTLTEALMGGSPAIDAGDNALCPPTDQRGVSRPQNGVCDIGAYEVLHSTTVTNTNDSGPGSLRDAIGLSGPRTTIDFTPALNGQTITLTSGALTIPTGLTIAGPGASHLTINGGGTGRVFDVEANQQADVVTISGLTITGGTVSGAGTTGGGGIFADTVHDLTLTGDAITGNSASVRSADGAGGGGVYVNGGGLTVANSTVTDNTATLSGATVGGNGGGGINDNGGRIVVGGSVVSNNTVRLTSTGNSGSDGGGGIYSNGGGVTLTNSTVNNNSATTDTDPRGSDGGGGLYEDGGTLTIAGSTINGNSFTLTNGSAGDNGGAGVYSNGGKTTVTTSSIDGNSATVTDNANNPGDADGGLGLYSEGGDLGIIASTIANNSGSVTTPGGSNGGGAVYDQGINTTYLNSTLSGNSITINSQGTQNGGGAIHSFGAAGKPISISASTIAGNTTNQPGGAIIDQAGTYTLKSTIVAGNSAPGCAGAGLFTSAGNNLESADTCGFHAGGDLTNTDPKLGPLQNNGGPTPTQALPANSPAVDTGSCSDVAGNLISTDQRGTPRPQPAGGACDIGAYELAQASRPPAVASVKPNAGPTAGGNAVMITGTGFTGATVVHFGSQAASFHVVNDTQITSTSPPGAAGTVDVTVTTPFGTSATGVSDRFTYSTVTPPPASAPSAQTSSPATKTSTGATFSGDVNPQGQATTYFFQYGLDPSLRPPGASTALYDQSTAPQTLPGDSSMHAVSAPVSGLVPNALYHVRLVARNAAGTTLGPDQTFTTPPGPPAPPPALGRSEAGKPLSGHVFALVAGQLVPVTQATKLPSGTVLDTRRGSIQLTAAAPGHKTITGVFTGAIFKLTQSHDGLTTLSLVEGAFNGAPSYASCRSHRAAGAHAALSSRVLQTLRSRASGRFRTRGRYAAGTVRGTQWTTADRCDGTLIAVQQHSVLVTDLVKHISVLVRAGHHYLARPRK